MMTVVASNLRFLRNAAISATLLCLFLITTGPLQAAELIQQRALYQQAKEQLKSNKMDQFYLSKAKLTEYPLYPYLEKSELEHRLNFITQHHINLYAKRYPDLPTTIQLQQRWLSYLGSKSRWKDYLTAYASADIQKEKYQCYQRLALLRTKQYKEAMKDVEKLWNVGHSISDICDPVFDYWTKKSTGPTSDQAAERFWKAVDNNSITLAIYLKRFIKDKKQRQQAALLLQVRNNPSLLKQQKTIKGDSLASRTTYLYGLYRLSRKSPQTATDIWLRIRDKLSFSQAQKEAMNRKLASRLFNSSDKKTDNLLAQLNVNLDEEIQQHRIKLALTKQDWNKVYSLIDMLSEELQQQEQWVYWKTIAASHTRDLKPSYSDSFFQLSKQRSYYGLLAADMLQSQFRLNPMQQKADPNKIQALQQSPAFTRMRELYLNQELYLARREWNYALNTADADTFHAASTIVHSWNWHAQAIRGAAKARYWDDIALRFPLPYSDLFAKKARLNKIDTNWARAIARQESVYQPTARSHVGARGLMQLMPRTAQSTARKNSIPYRRSSQLFIPDINISLGTAYLAEMQKRFDNNQVYASAAYNAGPHRVKRWLKERGNLPIDIWIETIPFKETRNYVKNVMAYHAVYRTLAGQPSHILVPQTAFKLAMRDSSGSDQAQHLREYIRNTNDTATINNNEDEKL
ncbi:transglycosylase SLT domain-containing protein [Amphritea sp. HPY]|uniref:transglycosylase SLT domain-containing protein n=1 Tax=Amphritea sp. HPY TaxID=3421652 RepID=UPI003D7E9887